MPTVDSLVTSSPTFSLASLSLDASPTRQAAVGNPCRTLVETVRQRCCRGGPWGGRSLAQGCGRRHVPTETNDNLSSLLMALAGEFDPLYGPPPQMPRCNHRRHNVSSSYGVVRPALGEVLRVQVTRCCRCTNAISLSGTEHQFLHR